MAHDAELWQAASAAQAAGDWLRAEALYGSYLQQEPDAPWALLNLGAVHAELGNDGAAEHYYLAALRQAANYDEAYKIHNNLCRLYLRHGRVDCVTQGENTVMLRPDFADGWRNYGEALTAASQHVQAIACFKRAASLGHASYHGGLLIAQRAVCAWEGVEALEAFLLAHPEAPMPLLAQFATLGTTGQQQKERAIRAAGNFVGPQYYPSGTVHHVHGRRIRLGYLSADFHTHAVALCLAETIENHDSSRFETHAFSMGPSDDDPMRRRLQAAFTFFHDFQPLSDAEVAARIHALGIDILIDLAGYTFRNRIGILARRPAPVQIHHLGWPGTMGASFIDYMIADPIAAPDPSWFTEKLLLLECYQPNDATKPVPVAPSRAALNLPPDALVLCAMNALSKLTPHMFDLWCAILRAVPKAVLWLGGANPPAEENLRSFAAVRGVGRQLIFAPRRPYYDYLDAIAAADLALDTFPYGGHATTSDILWAGVPVVTCRGPSFLSCVPSSLVSAAGIPECVVEDLGAYRELVLALCSDPARLARLKERLATGRRTSLLFDNRRYTKNLEAALVALIT